MQHILIAQSQFSVEMMKVVLKTKDKNQAGVIQPCTAY